MDFLVFRLILLIIVVVRNAFLPVSCCVSQFLDGFSLCQIGTGRVTTLPTIGRMELPVGVGVSRPRWCTSKCCSSRASAMAVMVRCPLVYVNTMFCSNRLSPACSRIILPWTVSSSSSVLSISCTSPLTTTTRDVTRHWFSRDSAHRSSASAAHELPLFAARKQFLHFFAREGQGHLPPSTWQVQFPWHMTRLHRVKHQRLSPSVQGALQPCMTTS